MINRAYRFVIPILALWLVTWIVISWAGIQDDALIHLRYADNLFKTHLITYDGVHPGYGASSLLYVYLLSALRAFVQSPDLPRIVSTFFHLLLTAGLVLLFLRAIPRESSLARLLGLITIFLIVSPSAVRWLDDGMETGFALCFVALLCWITFHQSTRHSITGPQYATFVVSGFFAVLLRTELLLICGLSFAILAWKNLFSREASPASDQRVKAVLSGTHLLLGALLALTFIRLKMHFLLPDTALAKSTGIPSWFSALHVTGTVLASALSFGAGMFFLWILTIILVLRAGASFIPALFANSVFPILLFLAALRGQQIQGARYFVWTLFFSVLWNILEIGRLSPDREGRRGFVPVYGFIVLLLLAAPFEARLMAPMLRERANIMKTFESQHFEVFQGKQGVAYDVGYVGYFSRASICDLAGLVNGREKATLNRNARIAACAASHPDFLYLNAGQIDSISHLLSLKDWQVCGHYDYNNVHTSDRHYLLLPSSTAAEVCRAVSNSTPSPDTELLPAAAL